GAGGGVVQPVVTPPAGPRTTASVLAALPQPMKAWELPAAALTNVAAWLADSVSGLPAGSAKLFTAKPTISAVAPAETFATAVFVSVTKANAGLPGELLVTTRLASE